MSFLQLRSLRISNPLANPLLPSGTNYSQTPSDNITAAEAVAKLITHAVGDNVGSADANAKDLGLNRSDNASANDALSKAVGRNVADNASAADATPKAYTKNTADNATGADARSLSLGKTIADNATAADSASLLSAFLRSVSDNVSAAVESIFKLFDKNLAENVQAADNFQKQADQNINVTDGVNTTDAHAKNTGKNIADQTTGQDAVAKNIGKNQADASSASDQPVRTTSKPIADSVNTADQVLKTISLTATEVLSAVMAIAKMINKSTSSPVSANDLVVFANSSLLIITDQVTAADLNDKQAIKAINDSSILSEAVAKLLQKIATEQITVTDSINVRIKGFGGPESVLTQRDYIAAIRQRGMTVEIEQTNTVVGLKQDPPETILSIRRP